MITTALLSNGATVFVIDRNKDLLNSVTNSYKEAIEKAGLPGHIIGLVGDVSKKTEAKRLADEIGKHTPRVTILFNNAGTIGGNFIPPSSDKAADFVDAFFDKVPEEAFDDVLRVNAFGPYWLTFAFLPLLEKWKENGYGEQEPKFPPQVIMTSSMNGWTKESTTSGYSYPYRFSKYAIGHATAAIARDLLPLGIRVNGIAPGFFISGMTTGLTDTLGQSQGSDMSQCPLQVPVSQLPLELDGPANIGWIWKRHGVFDFIPLATGTSTER